MANSNVTSTTAGSFIPELWAEAIKDYAERSLILKNLVTDMCDLAVNGSNKINIPKVAEEGVDGSGDPEFNSKTAGSDTPIAYTFNTDGEAELELSDHFYEAKRIEDVATVQSSYDLFNLYTEAMGYSLAKKVENKIATLIQSATTNDVTLTVDNQWGSTATTGAGSDHLRTGMANLWSQGIDTASGQCYLYASPGAYKNLLALDEFASAMKRGDDQNPYVTGALGMVYGMPVFVSKDWDDGSTTGAETASIFTKNAVAVAIQHLRVQSQYDIDHLATSVVCDCLFGATLVHDKFVSNFNQPA